MNAETPTPPNQWANYNEEAWSRVLGQSLQWILPAEGLRGPQVPRTPTEHLTFHRKCPVREGRPLDSVLLMSPAGALSLGQFGPRDALHSNGNAIGARAPPLFRAWFPTTHLGRDGLPLRRSRTEEPATSTNPTPRTSRWLCSRGRPYTYKHPRGLKPVLTLKTPSAFLPRVRDNPAVCEARRDDRKRGSEPRLSGGREESLREGRVLANWG